MRSNNPFAAFTAFLAIALVVPASSPAQEATKSADELAKELANPNTPLATMRLKNLYTFYQGDLPGAGSQTGFSWLFQPSFPFPVGEDGDVFFWRPAVPYFFETPVFNAATGQFSAENGFGDIAMDLGYGVTSENGLLTLLGLVTTIPTATNDLGKDQWLLGPEFLIGKLSPDYVIAAFPSHQWSIAGEDSFDTSISSLQLIATFLPGDGWSVGSAPIMTYDWEASQWSIPLNLTVSKTVILGKTPFKLDFTLDYYVETSDAIGPEWVVGLNVAPVVKNVLANMFSKKEK